MRNKKNTNETFNVSSSVEVYSHRVIKQINYETMHSLWPSKKINEAYYRLLVFFLCLLKYLQISSDIMYILVHLHVIDVFFLRLQHVDLGRKIYLVIFYDYL